MSATTASHPNNDRKGTAKPCVSSLPKRSFIYPSFAAVLRLFRNPYNVKRCCHATAPFVLFCYIPEGNWISPEPELIGQKISIPGDISSAAYFLAAALITEHSEILIKNVGTNPTRNGILRVCESMGAKLSYVNPSPTSLEPSADLLVRSSSLNATVIDGALIPTLIDEIPMIAVMACFAKGTTIIKDAAELKVKESNRIDVVVKNLKKMGAEIEATEDGMIIHGGKPLHGAVIDPQLDHRIAMSFAIAGLAAEGETTILHPECVTISYPDFFRDLNSLCPSSLF